MRSNHGDTVYQIPLARKEHKDFLMEKGFEIVEQRGRLAPRQSVPG